MSERHVHMKQVADCPDCLAREERLAELEREVEDPHCHYAASGRGDCEHAVGLPGLERDVDHDGPRTEDVYGRPNGWCWWCWKAYQLEKAEAALVEAERCVQLALVRKLTLKDVSAYRAARAGESQ